MLNNGIDNLYVQVNSFCMISCKRNRCGLAFPPLVPLLSYSTDPSFFCISITYPLPRDFKLPFLTSIFIWSTDSYGFTRKVFSSYRSSYVYERDCTVKREKIYFIVFFRTGMRSLFSACDVLCAFPHVLSYTFYKFCETLCEKLTFILS
jgi:hypothetical protein